LGPAVASADTGCHVGDGGRLVEIQMHEDRYLADFEAR